MASIDGISLDGLDGGAKFSSALALQLTVQSPISKIEQLDDWEFEVRRSSGYLVVRTKQPLDKDATLREGYEKAECFLDILSFENAKNIEIGAPGRSHILLFKRDSQVVIERMFTAKSPMSSTVAVTHHTHDGQIIPPPPSPPAKWMPALRFYRLSQVSRSAHEAYRNLWLGLEALLSTAVPKARREREGDWLNRSLSEFTNVLVHHPASPDSSKVVNDFIQTHYHGIRCNLFHAKDNLPSLMPSIRTAEEVLDAYAELVSIWRAIATQVGALRSTGCGIITYQGFEYLMAQLFSQVAFHATEDDAVPTETDKTISPNNCPVTAFDSSQYIGAIAPGKVENLGTLNLTNRPNLSPIHRITASVGASTLYSVDYFTGGFDVNGADCFEYRHRTRLLNTSLPRTHFD